MESESNSENKQEQKQNLNQNNVNQQLQKNMIFTKPKERVKTKVNNYLFNIDDIIGRYKCQRTTLRRI